MTRFFAFLAPSVLAGSILMGTFLGGCSKKDDGKVGAGADSTLALPDQPPLPPIEDEFAEPDSVSASGAPADPGYGQVAGGYYVLQVKLFEKRTTAVRFAENLKKSGIPAYVTEVVNPKPELQGTYYRVRAGSFATTAAARHYATINLEPLGISGAWVDLKARDSRPVKEVYTPRASQPAPPAPAAAPVPASQPVAPAPAPAAPTPAPAAAQPVPPPTVPAPQPPAPPPPQAPADTPHVEDW